MKEQITLARLRSLQDSVCNGTRKPFDLYDSETALFGRVGKTKITFYAYIARGQRQKLKSVSAHNMSKTMLDHLRSRARQVTKEYEKFDLEIFDSASVKSYLDSVYRDVVSKGVYSEINRFPDFVLNKPVNQLFLHHLERWKRERLDDGITHETLRKQYYALHSMLSYAVRQGHISHHHASGLKFIIDKHSTIAKVYTPDQMIRVQRVLKSCCLRDQAMVLFTVLSGSRPSETMRLKVSDIDFEHGTVFVRSSGTKTQVSRYLDLTPKLSEVLQDYLTKEWPRNPSDWLFFNPRTNDRLKGFRSVWEKIIDAAQIKGMRFYDFRHTYCSYLIQHYPIHVVQRRMGHRQIETTSKYLHHFSNQLQDVGDKLDDILGFSNY